MYFTQQQQFLQFSNDLQVQTLSRTSSTRSTPDGSESEIQFDVFGQTIQSFPEVSDFSQNIYSSPNMCVEQTYKQEEKQEDESIVYDENKENSNPFLKINNNNQNQNSNLNQISNYSNRTPLADITPPASGKKNSNKKNKKNTNYMFMNSYEKNQNQSANRLTRMR